jgi:hypothetical protein
MQSLAVLMNAIACPEHFKDYLQSSAHCVKQLVSWLRAMSETNTVAARAYQVLYFIVKTSKPFIWNEIMEVFPDEMNLVLQQPRPAKPDAQYLPWPGRDQSSEALFRYEFDGFGNYHFHAL